MNELQKAAIQHMANTLAKKYNYLSGERFYLSLLSSLWLCVESDEDLKRYIDLVFTEEVGESLEQLIEIESKLHIKDAETETN